MFVGALSLISIHGEYIDMYRYPNMASIQRESQVRGYVCVHIYIWRVHRHVYIFIHGEYTASVTSMWIDMHTCLYMLSRYVEHISIYDEYINMYTYPYIASI